MSLAKPPGQRVQSFARSDQSPTHSCTSPTMSKTPQLDLQLLRDPVPAGPVEFVTHVVEPSSALPSTWRAFRPAEQCSPPKSEVAERVPISAGDEWSSS